VGDEAVAGVVIDPGDDLDLDPISEEHAAHDVELPQRHRGVAFPALVVLPAAALPGRVDQTMTDQDPIHGHARGHRGHAHPGELMRQAARAPAGMFPAHLAHCCFDLGQ
jgi:hypothetical protein